MSSPEEIQLRMTEMEKIINHLNNQIASLMEENDRLKRTRVPAVVVQSEDETQYLTDEDELERETNWIVKNSKKRPSKKRKAEESPELNASKTKEGVPKESVSKEIRVKLPPPVHITGIADYGIIKTIMMSANIKDYKIVSLNNNVWKINTNDSESYRNLTKKITGEYQWFTYEDKNNRPTKVMARGLHPSCEIDEIIEDLKQQGLSILNAVNIIKKEKKTDSHGNVITTKRGLPLFMLSFSNTENVQNIYNIRAILNIKVKIEPLKKNTNLIPQCRKCQGFNHTQKYCGREERCVKCLGKHITKACTIMRNTSAQCVNCKGEHPANYRGCEVARELQKIRNQKLKQVIQKSLPKIEKNNISERKDQQVARKQVNKSYSDVLKQAPEKKSDNSVLTSILTKLDGINKRLEKQEELNKNMSDSLNKKFNIIEEKFERHDKTIDNIISTVNNLIAHNESKKKSSIFKSK